MKRILIGDPREALLATLETVLKHWGYRVTASGRSAALLEQLQHGTPDLLLLGPALLKGTQAPLLAAICDLRRQEIPVILFADPDNQTTDLDLPAMNIPVDLFQLFALIQQHLEHHPRRNLRLDVKLPGLLSDEKTEQLAEVLSISSQGLFVRTSRRLNPGHECDFVLPLLGTGKELELTGRILYQVEPAANNNYRQGLGIEFCNLSEEGHNLLLDYLERELMEDLVDNSRARPLDLGQLHLQGKIS